MASQINLTSTASLVQQRLNTLTEVNGRITTRLVSLEFLTGKKEKTRAYVDAALAHEREKLAHELSRLVFNQDGGYLQQHYIEPIKKFMQQVECFQLVLDKMKNVYTAEGTAFKAYDNQDKDNTPIKFNIFSDSDAFTWANGRLNESLNASNVKMNFRDALVESFQKNPRAWAKAEVNQDTGFLDARHLYDQAVADSIEITNIALEDYIEHAARTHGLEDVVRDIVTSVIKQSETSLVNRKSGLSANTERKYLIVPSTFKRDVDGKNLYDTVVKVVSDYASSIDVYTSPLSGRLICYTVAYAMPLNKLYAIAEWEAIYDKVSRKMIHSNESEQGDFAPITGLRWEDYPNLAYHRHATDNNSREALFIRQQLIPLFDSAEAVGLLSLSQDSNGCYHYHFQNLSQATGVLSNINREDPRLQDNHRRYKLGADLVRYLRESSTSEFTEIVRLEGNEALTSGITDPNQAKVIALRVIRRHIPMLRAIKKSLTLLQEIELPLREANQLTSVALSNQLLPKLLAYSYLRIDDQKQVHLFTTRQTDSKGMHLLKLSSLNKSELEKRCLEADYGYLLIASRLKIALIENETLLEIILRNVSEIETALERGELSANTFLPALEPFLAQSHDFVEKYEADAPLFRASRESLVGSSITTEDELDAFWSDSVKIYRNLQSTYAELQEI